MHGWLALVLVAGAAFTASFSKMAQDVPANIQPNLVQNVQVLGAEDVAQKSVLLMINSGNQTLLNSAVVLQANDTVLSLLTRALAEAKLPLETQKYDFGTIVNSINGIVGGTEGKYWLYSVNGQDGSVGVDQYQLEGGEIVSFRFAAS